MKENITSVHQLEEALRINGLYPFNERLTVGKSFYSPSLLDFEYIAPPLSIRYKTKEEGNTFENVDVVLVSATGATGKSALSKYLAQTLKQPIYDMGEAGPVGQNSLVGMLMNNRAMSEMTSFLLNLTSGNSFMILDALDEGALKVTSQALSSFYDEIYKLSEGASGIPFVITGRTQVMMNAAIELEERGLNVILLQIEPFTLENAKLFIDKAIEKKKEINKYNAAYLKVRDFIISSVEGFFQNINDMKHRQYERFIGYAPVLQTIATLLDDNCNYQQLYEELSGENIKNISLIINIIERILLREKAKVDKELLPLLVQNISPETVVLARENAYSITEQCIRIMLLIIHKECNIMITGDKSFDNQYEERIVQWADEHPFLSDEKDFVNVVFESYVISHLLQISEYRQLVMDYLLGGKYKTSYMFFDFYWNLNKEHDVDMFVVPYLYDSLISLDTKDDHVQMEVMGDGIKNIEVTFTRKNTEYTLITKACNESLHLPMYCSGILVDAPIKVHIPAYPRIDMTAPISLLCKEISFEAGELCLYGSGNQGGVVWEIDNLDVNLPNGINPNIRDYLKDHNMRFFINVPEKPAYPFVQYHTDYSTQDNDLTPHNLYYQKLRRLLLLFRSHSKGVLARYIDKIDNRIGSTIEGKKVIESLKRKNVMYADTVMYYLNNENLAKELGVKYDDVQAAIVNPQIANFIHDIESMK